MRTRTVTARSAALVLAASLVLAACGDDDGSDEAAGDGPEAQNVAAGSTLDSTWPLTGLPVTGDDEAAQEHPVMVLKMDNTYASSPQVGLGEADLVVEELVEGGMTRLAAFYYSEIPSDVGPVRSMRASDIGIVSPVARRDGHLGRGPGDHQPDRGRGHPVLRRGRQGLLPRLRPQRSLQPVHRHVRDRDAGRPGRASSGRPTTCRGATRTTSRRASPRRTLAANFSGGHTTNWRFEGGTYVNENTYAGAGDEFPADTVLVLRVKVGDAGYRDPAGNPVPETQLTGKGQALIFHDGRLVRGAVDQGRPGRTDQAGDQGRRADRPGGSHVDRAGAVRRRQRHLREVAASSALVELDLVRGQRVGQPDTGVGQRPEAGDDEADRGLHPVGGLLGVVGGGDGLARPTTSRRRRSARRSAASPRRAPTRRRRAPSGRCRGRWRRSSAPPARGTARSRAPRAPPGSRSGGSAAPGPPRGTRAGPRGPSPTGPACPSAPC